MRAPSKMGQQLQFRSAPGEKKNKSKLLQAIGAGHRDNKK